MKYAAAYPAFNKLIDDAMACDAGLAVSAIIESSPKVFDGLKTLVDVGGGNGTALGKIVRKGEGLRGMGLCP
uniref:O-methyltransferase C-terminal domain-containing protein n=1 Tax=Salix viminalis TaxID=40686 RepID=A0A6N2L5R0_SALVM